jgi:signal transduction histidine kinase
MGSKMCESDPSGCANILEKIDSDMKRIRESVIHLRALSNIEQPKLVPVDLNAMVSEALLTVKAEAGVKDVLIRVHRSSEVAQVKGDEIQLTHAMINLIRNAIEACADLPRDRHVIDISTQVIPEEKFELCVRDSGTGISPDVKEHMFSPFFSTKVDGIGIGLRLTQTIVQAHSGSITGFNNPEGSGATFRVVLPLDSGEIYTKE